MKSKGILVLSPFFSPDIGGVETHLDDLVAGLDRLGFRVYVLTHSPIVTNNVKWKSREKRGNNIFIRRFLWIGFRIFHFVEKYPLLSFLYLGPELLFRTFFWMLFNSSKIDVVHAQGMNSAWIGGFIKAIFKKKLVVTTHAVYPINPESGTAHRIASILKKADKIISINQQSKDQLVSFGLDTNKFTLFKQFMNLNEFKPRNKSEVRKKFGLENRFTVSFIGRMIDKKGARVLAEVATMLPDIQFAFVGTGPEENFLKEQSAKYSNIHFIGMVSKEDLPYAFNIADIFCIPSQYPEGFPRVIIEALASGLPIIASNLGGNSEVLDDSVAILIDPTKENIQTSIQNVFNNKQLFNKLKNNTVPFAEEFFGEKNIDVVTQCYEDA